MVILLFCVLKFYLTFLIKLPHGFYHQLPQSATKKFIAPLTSYILCQNATNFLSNPLDSVINILFCLVHLYGDRMIVQSLYHVKKDFQFHLAQIFDDLFYDLLCLFRIDPYIFRILHIIRQDILDDLPVWALLVLRIKDRHIGIERLVLLAIRRLDRLIDLPADAEPCKM